MAPKSQILLELSTVHVGSKGNQTGSHVFTNPAFLPLSHASFRS